MFKSLATFASKKTKQKQKNTECLSETSSMVKDEETPPDQSVSPLCLWHGLN